MTCPYCGGINIRSGKTKAGLFRRFGKNGKKRMATHTCRDCGYEWETALPKRFSRSAEDPRVGEKSGRSKIAASHRFDTRSRIRRKAASRRVLQICGRRALEPTVRQRFRRCGQRSGSRKAAGIRERSGQPKRTKGKARVLRRMRQRDRYGCGILFKLRRKAIK